MSKVTFFSLSSNLKIGSCLIYIKQNNVLYIYIYIYIYIFQNTIWNIWLPYSCYCYLILIKTNMNKYNVRVR